MNLDAPISTLAPNFTLRELIASQTAARKGLDNTPTPIVAMNLKTLAENVLQHIRDKHGPLRISSGYRSPAVNKAVGGSSTSQHVKGQAADIECSSISNYDLAVWIRDNLDFDQLILEAYTHGQPHSGWVHVSYVKHGENRRSVMTAAFVKGKAVYSAGLSK